jgi:hypothetical protein
MLNLKNLKPSILSEIEKITQQKLFKILSLSISISTICVTILVLGIGYLFKSKYGIEGNLPDFYLSFMGIIIKLIYFSIFYIFSCNQSAKEYSNNIITNIVLSGTSEPKLILSKVIVYNGISSFILFVQSIFVILIYVLLPESDITFDKFKPFLINFLFLGFIITLAVVFTILSQSSGLGILIGLLYILAVEIIFVNVLNLVNEKFLKIDWLTFLLSATPLALIQKISNSNESIEILTNIILILFWVVLILFLGLLMSRNRQITSR